MLSDSGLHIKYIMLTGQFQQDHDREQDRKQDCDRDRRQYDIDKSGHFNTYNPIIS